MIVSGEIVFNDLEQVVRGPEHGLDVVFVSIMAESIHAKANHSFDLVDVILNFASSVLCHFVLLEK